MNEGQKEFIGSLDALEMKDRVRLRRACGKTLDQADAETLRTFYGILPHFVQAYAENRWFAAACLHCLEDPGRSGRKPLAEQLGRAAADNSSDSLLKRGEILMDSDWDEDGYFVSKLYRLVRLLSQKGYPVDCCDLLNDLLIWNYENRQAQRRWARALSKN